MPDDAKPAKSRRATAQAPEMNWKLAAALFEGNQRLFSRWLESVAAFSQEVARFTQSRLEQDMAAWQALAGCRGVDEALDCQRRFAADAADQYAGEIAKLSQMLVKLGGESLSLAQRQSGGQPSAS
ncbi:MAG TPA: phasin family protein [Stellaceae bacterium]|nr:phasin family protein [Stellaceae bacterium]